LIDGLPFPVDIILTRGESIGSQKEAQRGQEDVNFIGEILVGFPPNRILSRLLGKILVLLLEGYPPRLKNSLIFRGKFYFPGRYAF
jgi:hypothetical protein